MEQQATERILEALEKLENKMKDTRKDMHEGFNEIDNRLGGMNTDLKTFADLVKRNGEKLDEWNDDLKR